MKKFVLVTGGARSGKSQLAEGMLEKMASSVLYVATAQIEDEEMKERVHLHKIRRPLHWHTIEAPFAMHEMLASQGYKYTGVLIDCLTLYLSNIFCNFPETEESELPKQRLEKALQSVRDVLEVIKTLPGLTVLVTNEVGWGLVPEYSLGREFRDAAGLANQLAAAVADEVYLCAAGLSLRLK